MHLLSAISQLIIGGVGPTELIIILAMIIMGGLIPAGIIIAVYKAGKKRGREERDEEFRRKQ